MGSLDLHVVVDTPQSRRVPDSTSWERLSGDDPCKYRAAPLDLPHSSALHALALGESLPMIGKLLGHTQCRRPRAPHTLDGTL